MNSSRILFTDIDDTLLNSKKEITPEVASAIHKAVSRGHKIVITTGRPEAGIYSYLRQLNLGGEGCYAICYNGGLIWDCFNQKAVYRISIPLCDVKYLFAKAKEAGIYAQTYNSTSLLAPEKCREFDFYQSRIHLPAQIDPGLPDSLTEEPIKVLMIDLDDHGRLERFRSSLSGFLEGRLNSVFSNPYYLEFVKEGISKGSAVRILAEMLGIPMENTVAAGDSENDISMIREARIGCVMANGTDEAKASADYVTERDCDHSGLAEIIEKFIL